MNSKINGDLLMLENMHEHEQPRYLSIYIQIVQERKKLRFGFCFQVSQRLQVYTVNTY
jgi:hypothetical protein